MSDKDTIILCAGGHARVVIDVLRRCGSRVEGLLEADAKLHGTMLDAVPILGGDDVLKDRDPSTVVLVNALGNRAGVGSSGLMPRSALYAKFLARGFTFTRVISPDAVISPASSLEEGVHVITGAIIHPGCSIGVNSIINTGARLDHDCIVGAHSHVAPAAVLCGNVTVGDFCHIGAGAVVIQGVKIGDGAVVGAGTVVVADVAAGATVLGRPGAPLLAKSGHKVR